LKVELPDELVREVETRILSSGHFDWLPYATVNDFVVDAVKARIQELIWGPGFDRRQS
jgi:protein involved in temperature-dependent protein secretion